MTPFTSNSSSTACTTTTTRRRIITKKLPLLFLGTRTILIQFLLLLLLALTTTVLANNGKHNNNNQQQNARFTLRLPGRPMERDDDDDTTTDDDNPLFRGRGREFDLFDNRSNALFPQKTGTAAQRVVVVEPSLDDNDNDESQPLLLTPESSSSSALSSLHDSPEDTSITATCLVSSSSENNMDPICSPSSSYPPLLPTPSLITGGGGGSIPAARFSGIQAAADYGGGSSSNTRSPRASSSSSSIFQPVSSWWTTNISPNMNMQHWPKIKCRMEPTTTLKLRKTFRPLKTIVRLGADFNTQLGVWQFKSSWEDAIIGGKITLAGKELQISKSWQLSVGSRRLGGGGTSNSNNNNLDDLITRLRFRAAIDLQTWKAYARVGFRTERLSPINVMEGFTLFQQIPLDGTAGHVKLEIKANFALPEPEIEYSTENKNYNHKGTGGFVGAAAVAHMGDIEINIDEFNLLLDY